MTRTQRLSAVALALSLASSAASAQIFSGVDVGGGVGGPRANSDAARLAWLAAAGTVIATETFEGIAVGSTAPLGLAGGMTLTTTGAPVVGSLNQVTNNQDPQIGYNTTVGGENFYRLSPDFGGVATLTITFASGVNSFGTYITGVQTAFGTTSATFGSLAFLLADTQGAPGQAGVQFLGFVSALPVTSVTFTTVANPLVGRDIMGFDDIAIATSAVPEPGTVGLTAIGLLATAGFLRRRRRA
jgi:hypothetical protein